MYKVFLRFLIAFFTLYALYLTDFGYKSLAKVSESVPYGGVIFRSLEGVFSELDVSKMYSRKAPRESDYIDLLLSADDLKDLQNRLNYYVSLGFIRDSDNAWRKAKVLQDKKKIKIKYKLHGTSVSPIKRSATLGDKVFQKINTDARVNLSNGGWSLKIKHNKDSQYNSLMRRYNLISSHDEIEISTIVINKIASEIGLMAPHGAMKLLRINGSKIGAFMMVENHGKEWLEREYGVTNYTIMKSNDDWDTKKPGHISDTDYHIQNKEISSTSQDSEFALGKLDELFSAIKEGNVEKVKSLIDVGYMAKYMAMLSITNNSHPITGDNLKYLYNHTTGKIKLIFRVEDSIKRNVVGISEFNNSIFASSPPYIGAETHNLFRLLLRDSKFRHARDVELQKIVKMKESFLLIALQTYRDNINIIMNGNVSYRKSEYLWGEFLESLDENINKAVEYLNYSKIYTTKYTRGEGNTTLEVVLDSYVNHSLADIKYAVEDSRERSTDDKFSRHKTIPSPDLDHELNIVYRPSVFSVKDREIASLSIINAITGNAVNDVHIYINNASESNIQQSKSISSMLDAALINYKIHDRKVDIYKGKYEISADLVFPSGYDLRLHSGVVMNMAPSSSILVRGDLVIDGSKDDSVVVRNKVEGEPFGVFAILGSEDNPVSVEVNYLKVAGGSSAVVNGVSFSGQMSIHHSNTLIKNSSFSNSYSDDGLNIKNSQVDISNSTLFNNNGDQVDLDYCTGKIHRSVFYYDHQGLRLVDFMDGVDVSGSEVEIKDNYFNGFTDKAVSVGEYSSVGIYNNNISGSVMGVAIKDGSSATISDNEFTDNTTDITGYVKKKMYPIPKICVKQSNAPKVKITSNMVDCSKKQNWKKDRKVLF